MTTTTAPAGLGAVQRTKLDRLIIRARTLLESDFAAQAEGRFGIHPDGTIEDEAALPDNTTDKITRADLEQIVAHLGTLCEEPAGAVARMLREAAFTHLNRLISIRIAEAIGLLPESLANGSKSRGFRDLGEIMPMLAGDYRAYLRLCGDELAADAPVLFDPRNPLLALEPSTGAFNELVALMADPGTADIWPAPDALGWAYQFFNTADERREMREAQAPRNSRELAVRNQFFTPRYVVDFLVQNTIGRRLIESDPASPLLNELPMLIDPPTEPGPFLALEDVKCLDPACGSGHFLLGCYDVLERVWDLAGVAPSESAPKIVASLWGVDIDARCAQVASAAIVLRARRHCRDLVLPRPNIVTARGLPGGSSELPPSLQLTPAQRDLIDRVSNVLAGAPLLGVLLQAEKVLDREIRHAPFGGQPGTLPLNDEAAATSEHGLLNHLQAIADQASSSVIERLLAAEADDAIRLIDVVRQRYDAVLMNPPFGAPVPETKRYLNAAYTWLPGSANLYAAFVGRGLELCKPDGYIGAITSRAGLFIKTLEKWRRNVVLGNRLITLADLGYRVMHQAKVEAAAYVIAPGRPVPQHRAVFARILKEPDRATALAEVITASRAEEPDPRIFRVATADFDTIPGSPVAYWMSPPVRRLFTDLPRLEGKWAEVRVGLQTSDDFRFVRAFWEVDPSHIARSREEAETGRRWCPFAKGGEYAPYYADIHLVVDWENDGQHIRNFHTDVLGYSESRLIRSEEHYFRPGLTWSARTNSAMAVRVLPAGCIFSHKGPALFASDLLLYLGWLDSRVVRLLIDATAASADEDKTDESRNYDVGIIQSLPSPVPLNVDSAVPDLTADIAHAVAAQDATYEMSRRFVGPTITGTTASIVDAVRVGQAERWKAAARVLDKYARLDKAFANAVSPPDAIEKELRDASGPLLAELPQEELSEAENDDAARLLCGTVADAVEAATARLGVARWIGLQHQIIDRRLELAALVLGRSPRLLAEHAATRGLYPAEEVGREAADLASYLVGCAFGRWDVRIGRDPTLAPTAPELFDPVCLCSPGQLTSPTGLPTSEEPVGYPLRFSPSRLLVDQKGHTWDIETAVLNASEAMFDDPASMVGEMLQILGCNTVRDYLRKQFFKDHLTRYSKSRRKAPLYWPLTVPSKNWGVWVYAPMLTRETLYAVALEAGKRERLASEAITRLQREQREGGIGRPARKVSEELDAEEKLGEELRRFRIEAERIAGLGWEPNLDDGIILCAAPLADLFPAWPDSKTARAELRKGKYPWATVAAWADRL
jgi:hypothetical protein